MQGERVIDALTSAVTGSSVKVVKDELKESRERGPVGAQGMMSGRMSDKS